MSKVILQYEDQDIAEIFCNVLEGEGYSTLAITTVQHIFLQIDVFQPQVVLLDFTDPESAAVCRRIRDEYPQMAIIALSGNHLIANEYSKYGFNGYLAKPFNPERLSSAIELFGMNNLAHAS